MRWTCYGLLTSDLMLSWDCHRLCVPRCLLTHVCLRNVAFGRAYRLHGLLLELGTKCRRLHLRVLLVLRGATINARRRLAMCSIAANCVGSIESTWRGRCSNPGQAMVEGRELHRVGNRCLLVLNLHGSWPDVRQADHIEF